MALRFSLSIIKNRKLEINMELSQNTLNSNKTKTTPEQSPRTYLTQNEMASLLDISPQAISLYASKLELKSYRQQNKSAYSPLAVRKFFQARGFNYPKEVIAFQMLKGGSTKTSSAFNLAIRLNQYGAKVLCVDLDMQGNLSDALGIEVTEDHALFIHIARGEATIEETIIPICEGLDLIPSEFENSTLDYELSSKRKNLASFVKTELDKIRDNYDFIIIDCNPALSSLNISIALASDRIVIPVNPDRFSKRGLAKTITELERVGVDYKQPMDFSLLYTLYDARESSSQKYLIEYGSTYRDRLLSTVIKRNTDVKNAIDQKKSIFDFPRAPAREDFDLVARELLGWRKELQGNA
jgi:chromosome partitioning protein